jgi:hypothetical protein
VGENTRKASIKKMSWPKFKPSTSRIQVYNITARPTSSDGRNEIQIPIDNIKKK